MIIPPGFASITVPIRHSALPRAAAVTFGVDSSNWPGDYVDMCDRIGADFDSALSAGFDSQVSMGPVRASVGQDGGENLSVEGTYTWSGDAAGERQSAQIALLVKKLTARGGRRGRGRMYFPWMLSETGVDETGRLGAGVAASYQSLMNNWRVAALIDPGSTPLYLLHSAGASAAGNPDEITALLVDPVTGTQRRRVGR